MAEREEVCLPIRTNTLAWLTHAKSAIDIKGVLPRAANLSCAPAEVRALKFAANPNCERPSQRANIAQVERLAMILAEGAL
jgi:hypothetical protein